jgi:hypothetical protein
VHNGCFLSIFTFIFYLNLNFIIQQCLLYNPNLTLWLYLLSTPLTRLLHLLRTHLHRHLPQLHLLHLHLHHHHLLPHHHHHHHLLLLIQQRLMTPLQLLRTLRPRQPLPPLRPLRLQIQRLLHLETLPEAMNLQATQTRIPSRRHQAQEDQAVL